MSDKTKIKGMGAIPHAGGVAFRVWAPHAQRVSVRGTAKTSSVIRARTWSPKRAHTTASPSTPRFPLDPTVVLIFSQ
jgi:1,4-alpha-glucan branching enzyme